MTVRRSVALVAVGAGALIAAVLARGYWHAATHAVLDVEINDVSLRTDRQAYGPVRAAGLTFRDAGGTVLATGRIDDGVLAIAHPTIGDCRREERAASSSRDAMAAWDRCFATKSRWLTTWAKRLRYASVSVGECRIEDVPVSLEASTDAWWLWWIPHPHIGGLSYTYVRGTLTIDSRACRAAR